MAPTSVTTGSVLIEAIKALVDAAALVTFIV